MRDNLHSQDKCSTRSKSFFTHLRGFHKQTQVKYQMCILTWIEQLAEHQVKNKKKRKSKPKKGKKVCSIEMLD